MPKKSKRMVVVGCGRMGADLADRLFRRGYMVTVVDRSEAAMRENLLPDFRGNQQPGDIMEREVCDRVLKGAHGVAAVTNLDTVNAIVGRLARLEYDVPHVVARNYHPRWLPLLTRCDVQAISSSIWGAQRMEELLDNSVKTVFSAGNGEIEVYEFIVGSNLDGRPLAGLLTPDCLPVAVTTNGTARLPAPDTVLAVTDVVHIAATLAGAEALAQAFGKEG